jgi:hypothetical protein
MSLSAEKTTTRRRARPIIKRISSGIPNVLPDCLFFTLSALYQGGKNDFDGET